MRLRHQTGEDVALTVLRRYLRTQGADPATLLEYARVDISGPVRIACRRGIGRMNRADQSTASGSAVVGPQRAENSGEDAKSR